jgi:hypothetical protein
MANNSLSALINKNDNKKEKVFKDAEMKITGNIVFCDNNTFIQISNISQVNKGVIPKSKLPLMPLAFSGGLGFILLLFGLTQRDATISAIFGIIILGVVAFVIYKNYKEINYYGLIIEITSGGSFSFISDDEKFISKVFNVLGNIIEDGIKGDNVLVNFGSGTIINQSETGDIKQGDFNDAK